MSTLHDLVQTLGPDLIRVAVAPRGLDVHFSRVVIYDTLDLPAFHSDDLVLAVGVPAESSFALRTVQGAAGLLLRQEGSLDERLVAEALSCGTALLTLARNASWSQVHEIVLSLRSHPAPVVESSLAGTELMQDLFAIANAVAERVGAPITIEDNQSRLLAYSARHEGADGPRAATILGHRVPEGWRNEIRRLGASKRLLVDTEPFHLMPEVPDICPRMVVAIRAREEVLGSIWALAEEPFDEETCAAFSDAARTVAVRMLHHRMIADLNRQQQAAVLAILLAGGDAAAETARRVGLAGETFRLLAIGSRNTANHNVELLDRVWSELSMRLSLRAGTACIARLDETVYCIIPGSGSADRTLAEARDIVQKLRAALEPQCPDQLVMGISGEVSSVAELPQARDEADRVLHVLRSSTRGYADLGEVDLQVTLLRLADLEGARPSRSKEIVDVITRYDTEHATNYVETLRVYLSSFGDPTIASRELGVHTNTLRYRVRRLNEMFGLDLSDDDARFALMLHFRLQAS